MGGFGNSGIAVGGATLYLANNGGSQIYTSDKAFSAVTLFATLSTRLEDMECDNVTFASANTEVIWVIDAFDRAVNAFTIPSGSCGFGGVTPGPPASNKHRRDHDDDKDPRAVVPAAVLVQPVFTG